MMAGVYYFNYKNVIAEDISSAAKKSSMVGIVQKFLSLEHFNKKNFEIVFLQHLQNPDFKPLPSKYKTIDLLRLSQRSGNEKKSQFIFKAFGIRKVADGSEKP
jgi:hypothetical protein